MSWKRTRVPGRILDLTLEIIYLLTGQVYVPETKPISHVTSSSHNCVSEGRHNNSPIMDPSPPFLISERKNKEILHVTQKITDLLTGEVPIRCQDVTVYFSMEEWEYLEGHKDLYKDVMMEEEPDGSRKRNPPQRCLHPLDSMQEPHEIPHHDQGGVLVDVKVEVKEEVEDVMGGEPWKDEEVPTKSSSDRQKKQNNAKDRLGHKPEDIFETSSVGSPRDDATSRCFQPYLQRADSPHDPSTHRTLIPAWSRIITHDTSVSYPDQGPVACSECGKCFFDQALYLAHRRSHTGEKSYVCPYCRKGFAHKSDFNKHQRIHTGEKPFSCLECGKSFSQKSNHMRHQKVHLVEKPYSCSCCGKGFSQKANFQRHVQSHAGGKSYSCRECGQHFSLKAHLLQHQTIHRGHKPYCCKECGKCFAHQSSFYRHQRNHTGEKPYACGECGDRFTQRSSLARHQQRHLQLLH